jgi:hypothetical protein
MSWGRLGSSIIWGLLGCVSNGTPRKWHYNPGFLVSARKEKEKTAFPNMIGKVQSLLVY